MMESESLLIILGLASLATIIVLIIILFLKTNLTDKLRGEVTELRKMLDETDEQAKLIVRTDMELNKAQEELDKKITSLYALQKLSRTISTTLEENQIFKKIESADLEELGFEKCLAFLWQEKERKYQCYLDIGYSIADAEEIKGFLDSDKDAFLYWITTEKTLSTISASHTTTMKDRICDKFKVSSFVLAPILPNEGNKGFIFVGTNNTEFPITAGDEELITILGTQIGQALENARLFDKTWRAQQDLEIKIRERTRELTLALEEVRKISRHKSEFVSSVSHELRTPLTSIKGYASILLAGNLGELPEQIRLRLDKINRHSDELVVFVNELLDIARIESGKVMMKPTAENLNNIVEEAADLLSTQIKEKQINFSFNMPEDARIVMVDRGQIKRVFINLISNAIKFTPEKGSISITSHRLEKEKQIQVDISDTGCGIPDEARDHIFEEFYRVDNIQNQELKGTGLGLTLVKNIIEAHQGMIWVKSHLGTGSTFSFILPA